jgi:hypothetical protein
MASDITFTRVIAAAGLGAALALAATLPAAAQRGGGGSNGDADTYLRQELHNPGFLNSRQTRFNNSRPWPEQYADPAATYYGPPPGYGYRAPVRVWIPY